jgi:WhiB family redox-sensing transcriptional regulator
MADALAEFLANNINLDALGLHEEWRAQAACRGMTELFMALDKPSVRRAKAVCRTCPVRRECGDLAAREHLFFLVYGGVSAQVRRKEYLRRQREVTGEPVPRLRWT